MQRSPAIEVQAQSVGFANKRRKLAIERMLSGDLVQPISHDQEYRQPQDTGSEGAEHIHAGRISPVQVLQDDQNRSLYGQPCKKVANVLKQGILVQDRATQPTTGKYRRRIERFHRFVFGEKVEPWTLGRAVCPVIAMSDHDHDAPMPRLVGNIPRQARLAATRLAAEQHQATTPANRRRQFLVQEDPFAVAADQLSCREQWERIALEIVCQCMTPEPPQPESHRPDLICVVWWCVPALSYARK